MLKSKFKKPITYDFDLIVIGSGAGGGVAAHLAAAEGRKVAIIESGPLGGSCPHDSCIPTKALLKTAETLEIVQGAHQFGVRTHSNGYNFKSVHAWQQKAINATGAQSESVAYKSSNITVIKGHGQFISPWVVSVRLRRYTARKFIIATGGGLVIPNIIGLDTIEYLTYKDIHKLPKPPKSIFIVGGGATAYEYAQILSAFGTRVHIAERGLHLLTAEDPEVGDSAEAALATRNVRVHTAAKVVSISGNSTRKLVTFEQHGQQHKVSVEHVMIAVGKRPNIDLGLENTGVSYTSDGIRVNRFMQTNKPHIYAVGDVIGKNSSTHASTQEARIAAHNMYHHKKVAMDYTAIPRVFYGKPEIAIVGKTEHELKLTGLPYQTSIAPIGILGRAITSNYTAGFVKITATHTGVLLGASIVAPHACEMIGELTLAIQLRRHACDVANIVHPFPSWSEAIRIAASRIQCI